MPKQIKKGERQTEGATRRVAGFDGYSAAGGLGVVPRAYDAATEDLLRRCESDGLRSTLWMREGGRSRLLRVLVDTHPMGAMALANNLDLPFGAGATTFYAVKDHKSGKGVKDDAETAALQAMLRTAFGSVEDLQKAIGEALHTDGMAVVEAVPGGTDALTGGIDGIYDADALTFRWRDADPALGRHGRILEQRQRGGISSGWKPIDQTTVFTTSYRFRWDRPYGLPVFSAFLTEGIADAYHNRGISDGLRGAFYSRLVLQSTWSRFHELGKQALESEDREYLLGKGEGEGFMSPAEFADAEMQKLLDALGTLTPDDIAVMPEGSEPQALNITLQGVSDVLDKRLLRVSQSLLQFPALLGITFGGREAWAAQQVKVYVNRLDADRSRVNDLIAKIGDLFFRLRGVDMVCRWEAEPITLQDLKALAEARQAELAAIGTEVAMGFTDGEDAALRATGTGLASPEQHQRWLDKQTSGGQATAPTNGPDPGAGATP